VFSAQAQLAKSSFVLDRKCVLTGGFAFFIWFGENPHAGDFVLTLGGYNPAYKPPAHYPSVPTVGFQWSLSESITISGGAYFAVTPAVLMAGGRLDATYQAGNLKAWFDAHADVLIRWKPFWIDAEIGITIGASYKVDLLCSRRSRSRSSSAAIWSCGGRRPAGRSRSTGPSSASRSRSARARVTHRRLKGGSTSRRCSRTPPRRSSPATPSRLRLRTG
jgi:hypothetical protein